MKSINKILIIMIVLCLIVIAILGIKVYKLENNNTTQTSNQKTEKNENNMLVGKWKASTGFIYILEIKEDNTVIRKDYWPKENAVQGLTVDEIENSDGYRLHYAAKGKLTENTIVFNERLNTETNEWEKMNEIIDHISITSEITLQITSLKPEFVKE